MTEREAEDEALELLREDQRRSGLTIAQYERKYGVILGTGPSPMGLAGDIKRHEVLGHEATGRFVAPQPNWAYAPDEIVDED